MSIELPRYHLLQSFFKKIKMTS